MTTFDMKSATMHGVTALEAQNPMDFAERAKWMNASEAGTCIRQQWYKKHTVGDAPEEDRGYARRGHAMERYMVEALTAANIPLHQGGEDQVTYKDPATKLSVTPDGVLVLDDERVPVDFKSIDPRTNKKNLPRPAHVLQVKIAMHLIGLYSGPDARARPINRGLLVYTDASNYDDIIQFDVDPLTPAELTWATKRAKKLLTTRVVNALDREGKTAGGKECKTCAFAEACGVASNEVAAVAGRGKGNRGSALADHVATYVGWKAQKEAVTAGLAAVSEDIKKELKRRKLRTINVAGHKIDLQQVAGRKGIDKKGMQKDGVLAKYETVGSPSERLAVTEE